MKIKVTIFILFMVASVGAVASYVYYAPRVRISNFTEAVTPLFNEDVKEDKKMLDYFDKLDADFKKLNPDKPEDDRKLITLFGEAATRMDESQKVYESVLKRMNKLEAPPEGKRLKSSFVELNNFYTKSIPKLKVLFVYNRQLMIIADKYLPQLEAVNSKEPADVDEAISLVQREKNVFLSMRDELSNLRAPAEMADFHSEVTASYDEMLNLIGETESAIKRLDVTRLDQLEQRYTELGKKADEFERLAGSEILKNYDPMVKAEDKVLIEARKEVRRLEKKYGDDWVSDELKFKIEEGREIIRDRKAVSI